MLCCTFPHLLALSKHAWASWLNDKELLTCEGKFWAPPWAAMNLSLAINPGNTKMISKHHATNSLEGGRNIAGCFGQRSLGTCKVNTVVVKEDQIAGHGTTHVAHPAHHDHLLCPPSNSLGRQTGERETVLSCGLRMLVMAVLLLVPGIKGSDLASGRTECVSQHTGNEPKTK